MPNPLALEVTIRITVDRNPFGRADERICDLVDRHENEIRTRLWDSVSVRVAETETTECPKS